MAKDLKILPWEYFNWNGELKKHIDNWFMEQGLVKSRRTYSCCFCNNDFVGIGSRKDAIECYKTCYKLHMEGEGD